MPAAPDFWTKRNGLTYALWPLSLLYRLVFFVHQFLRKARAWRAPVSVISVGNMVAGGAGKTPIVAHLAKTLAERGHMVAILSRGYGGKVSRPHRVMATDGAAFVGDEPRMLFEDLADFSVHIWVGGDRKAQAKRAVTAGATVLILDDGLQTTQVQRDVDMIVTDGTQGFGNGFLMPAGPLRCPLSALERADVVVCYGERVEGLPPSALSLSLIARTDDVLALRNKRLLAFCGLGRPDKFFLALRRAGGHVVACDAFSDHHVYTQEELDGLRARAKGLSAILVTTHKDAVKLPNGFATVIHADLAGDVAQLEERVLEKIRTV